MVDRERDRRVLQNPIKSDFQPSVISRPKFIQLHTFTQVSPLHIAHGNNSEILTILSAIGSFKAKFYPVVYP